MNKSWVEVVFVDSVFEVYFRVEQTDQKEKLETVIERHEE